MAPEDRELSDALAGVEALYTANLAEHGTARPAWAGRTADAQRLRFDKLAYVICADAPDGDRSPSTTGAAATAPCSGTSTSGSAARRATPATTSAPRCSTRRAAFVDDPRASWSQGSRSTEDADYSFVSGHVQRAHGGDVTSRWERYVEETLRAARGRVAARASRSTC